MASSDVVVWQNRILNYGTQKASLFKAHPSNYRRHPARQSKALKGSLDTLGWVQTIIVNKATGYIVDGHERVEAALRNGDAEVPFITVDLSPEEEAQALLSLDAIAALAQTDAGKVDELLRMVETDNTDVMQFLSEMASSAGVIEPELYQELEQENQDLAGMEEVIISITIPVKYEAEVREWLANGETKTGPGLGKGVMRRCGLL
jgi:ParB-like chromosome segregation protein Spo0J